MREKGESPPAFALATHAGVPGVSGWAFPRAGGGVGGSAAGGRREDALPARWRAYAGRSTPDKSREVEKGKPQERNQERDAALALLRERPRESMNT